LLILIDTNILVYASDPTDPYRQELAANILTHLGLTLSGRISVQSLAEFFNVTTSSKKQLYTRGEAYEQVERLMQTFPIFDLTSMIALEAARGCRDYYLAYFDAQIWATARLNQVPVIFSEDFSHGQELEGVRFINPFKAEFHLQDWT